MCILLSTPAFKAPRPLSAPTFLYMPYQARRKTRAVQVCWKAGWLIDFTSPRTGLSVGHRASAAAACLNLLTTDRARLFETWSEHCFLSTLIEDQGCQALSPKDIDQYHKIVYFSSTYGFTRPDQPQVTWQWLWLRNFALTQVHSSTCVVLLVHSSCRRWINQITLDHHCLRYQA